MENVLDLHENQALLFPDHVPLRVLPHLPWFSSPSAEMEAARLFHRGGLRINESHRLPLLPSPPATLACNSPPFLLFLLILPPSLSHELAHAQP